ncbi:CaiB/BaiF CoA transferase family protein [Streptomyces krungchingensis]|uniref:CaiB/BaiF CoA transferase family protein n=1 Tax=Streptomyces krungchingensis TaxID=1565034 RepID=UPI003CFB38FA
MHGIRVLDFSAFLPGPFASLVLAEAGADVVRIEPAGSGDPLRFFEPLLGPGRVSAMYAMLNRGKRAFGADMTDPGDRASVLELAAAADVVIVQERPGVAERRGLGYDELSRRNPRLIHCAITGYGSSGPHAERAGFDLAFMADSGLLGAALSAEGAPVLPATSVADIAGGTYPALINILLALHRRERTGRGTSLEISMAHNLQALGYRHFVQRQARGSWPDPRQDFLGGGSARYHIYPTADGRFVAVYALHDRSWDRLVAVLGLTVEAAGDGNGRDAVRLLTDAFLQHPAARWRDVFASTGIKATVVSHFGEAERSGLIDTDSADRVRCGDDEVGTLPSVVDPNLRRPPGTLDCPELAELGTPHGREDR